MEPHPALAPDQVERLRAVTGGTEPAPPAPAGPRRFEQKAKGLVKKVVGKAIGWYVAERTDVMRDQVMHHVDDLARRVEALAPLQVNLELLKGEVGELHALTVNQELLKGEFRALQATIDELGMAIAPATGLAGAAERIAELREKVNAVERRVRHAAAPPARSPEAAVAGGGGEAVQSRLFDYVGFERRFRGDPAKVIAALTQRYGDLLASHGPVLDIGCGRGELLSALAERGVEVLGVDTDPGMVSEARGRGLEVHEADAVEFLRARPEGSIGSIIATHVVEHLQLDHLIELLELAVTRLHPGGVFVAETPNPASLIVLGNSYILDPTHVRPLHPSLLSFLCEGAGFRDVRLRFYEPATAYHLPTSTGNEAVDAGFARLNEVLFGPQEYAVVATAPPA